MSQPHLRSTGDIAPTPRPGKVGIWSMELRFGDPSLIRESIAEIEQLGFSAVWIPGGIGGELLLDLERLLDASTQITVATGILNIYKHEPAAVAAWLHSRSQEHQARLMLGLGVSHAPLIGESYSKPLAAMGSYLDALDTAGVPPERRCLAALGPQMLELARRRSAGAHPYLVTPEHTAAARAVLGPQALLAPEQGVILETDATTARATARRALVHYMHLPNYLNSWRRMGFAQEDVTQVTDRFVDGLFAWGTLEHIAARVQAHLAAGADQVCLQVLHPQGAKMQPPREVWRTLASALL